MPTYAACFLCKFADQHIVKFAEEMSTHMPVYMVCDLEPADLQVSPKITVIHVDETAAKSAGFQEVNITPWLNRKPFMALDKALFYFATTLCADYVWFVEEDVFLPRVDSLYDLDRQYPSVDLITKEHNYRHDTPDWVNWSRHDMPLIDPPHVMSMSCCVRLSRAMLAVIRDFGRQKGQLAFLEILFNSLAERYGLTVITPPELKGVEFRQTYTINSFTPQAILHPIKNTSLHGILRHFISLRQMVGSIAPMIGHDS